jgi:hypothetical protein
LVSISFSFFLSFLFWKRLGIATFGLIHLQERFLFNIQFNRSNIESVSEVKVSMKANSISDGKYREKKKLKHKQKRLRTFQDCLIGILNWGTRTSKEKEGDKEGKWLWCLEKGVVVRDVMDVIDWISKWHFSGH